MHSSDGILAPDPIVVLLLALLTDAVLGEPRWRGSARSWLAWPVDAFASFVDVRLNRPERTAVDRKVRGAMMAFVVASGAVAIGFTVHSLQSRVPLGWVVEVALVTLALGQRAALAKGRRALARLDRSGDPHDHARAGIEALATALAATVVAPALLYLVLGLPGLLMHVVLARTAMQFDTVFGAAARNAERLLNAIPAVSASLLMAVAAPVVPEGNPGAALRTMARGGSRRLPGREWPIATAAGALGLAPEAARSDEKISWPGDGRVRTTRRDLHRMLYLFGAACLVHVLAVILLALFR